MSMLSQRLQVLLDPNRQRRLQLEAARRGVSVARLVREAIDQAFPATTDERLAALERVLAAPPMPVPSVAELRAELESVRGRRA